MDTLFMSAIFRAHSMAPWNMALDIGKSIMKSTLLGHQGHAYNQSSLY